MVEFMLNGKKVCGDESKNLLRFLRDDMRVTSVKDGCSSGACGTCTVIIDGKSTRACIVKISNLKDKSVTTIEGLSQREKDVYSYAFAEAGAVQCGFCIPGMVLSAKALIDLNNAPVVDDIKKAIRGNICRCTGYIKIIDAILLSAKMIRENAEIPLRDFTGAIGEDIHRIDAVEKTLGTGIYAGDVSVPDMVYGKALRVKYPRALVKKIDYAKAAKHPDCVGILTAKDIPGKQKIGHLIKDWDVLIPQGEITHYIGDSVALVAAKTKESLEEILSLIEVEYEELPCVRTPIEAMAEGAPKVHESGNILKHEILTRGNVKEALAKAKHIVTHKYSTPFTEHAFMEPECAVAMPYEGDGVLLYTGGQSVYDEQREVMEILGLPNDKVRVISKLVGGGFGGKEDMSVQHHAALLAYITKKAVKVEFSRQESINIHPKRHAMEIEMTSACDENGYLVAMEAKIVSDTGAYASLGGPVLQRACTHAAGPYNFHNINIEGTAVYTNNPPAGAFRGFGVTQSIFASECNLNLLAQKVGISPWEIRYRNAVRPGQALPNGQIADESTALVECLEAVKDVYLSSPYAGIASSFKNSGLGVGVPDTGRCIISVEDGKVHVRTSAACIGQGMATVSLQITCDVLRISPKDVVVEMPDTLRTPNSGTTTASRQTVFTGEATRQAALKLKVDLDKVEKLSELNGKEYYGEYVGVTDPIGSDKTNPISHVAYGYGAQVVIIDEKGKVEKVVAAYDVGTPINRKSVEGQIEGGIAMGLGFALTEDYPLIDCIPQAKYGTLGLWRSTDMPEIETLIVKREYGCEIASGAKGVGELATIPTAPAVQGAYYRLDDKFRKTLPMEDTYYRKKK